MLRKLTGIIKIPTLLVYMQNTDRKNWLRSNVYQPIKYIYENAFSACSAEMQTNSSETHKFTLTLCRQEQAHVIKV
jgi:hypothetical protein